MIRLRHRVLVIALAILLTGSLAPAAAARTVDPPTLHRVTWTALKYEIARHRIVVGPNRDTGYGKMVLTGLRRIPGTHRYRATYKVYDMTRVVLGARSYKICWPWERHTVFGCASPLNPGTWDWGDMVDKLVAKTKDYTPYSPMTYTRQQKCARGAIKAGSYGAATKIGVGLTFGQKLAQAKPTPQAWAIGIIGGCLVSMWW